jgi:hypothetical protein
MLMRERNVVVVVFIVVAVVKRIRLGNVDRRRRDSVSGLLLDFIFRSRWAQDER